MPQTKTKSGLDLITEYTLQQQKQAIVIAEEAERAKPAVIPEALRGHVHAYFRTIGLRDFSAVDLFFAWAGERVFVDPENAMDEWKLEHPHLFDGAPVAEVSSEPRPRVFVDETSERHVYHGYVVTKFRPNQEITDPHALALAQRHGIALREGFERPSAPRPAGSAGCVAVVEERDRYVAVGITTVVFRTGETLTDPHKVQLARLHGIAISEK